VDGTTAGSDAAEDAGTVACTTSADASAAGCYAITCTNGGVHSLGENRDRLLASYAARRCTDTCTLWAALNEAERYVFLMDTRTPISRRRASTSVSACAG
jgi:hypothetical protein